MQSLEIMVLSAVCGTGKTSKQFNWRPTDAYSLTVVAGRRNREGSGGKAAYFICEHYEQP
jgi:hypothetical protein